MSKQSDFFMERIYNSSNKSNKLSNRLDEKLEDPEFKDCDKLCGKCKNYKCRVFHF